MNKIKAFFRKLWDIFLFFWNKEFIRYLFVGGTAYIVDHLIFFFVNTFMPNLGSFETLHIASITNACAVGAGFICGTIVNTIMSMTIVFKGCTDRSNGSAGRDRTFSAFTLISVIGFAITLLLNQLCINIWGEGKILELVYSLTVSIPVILWNYFGKKAWLAIDKKMQPQTKLPDDIIKKEGKEQ